MCLEDEDGVANSVDPNKTAPLEQSIGVYTVCSDLLDWYLGFLWYVIYFSAITEYLRSDFVQYIANTEFFLNKIGLNIQADGIGQGQIFPLEQASLVSTILQYFTHTIKRQL